MKKIFKDSGLFISLFVLIKLIMEEQNSYHSIWLTLGLSLILVFLEKISDQSPKSIAQLFIHRKYVISTVVGLCLLTFIFSYLSFTYNHLLPNRKNYIDISKEVFGFTLIGALLGLITRMLLIHYYYQTILAKKVFKTKILLMVVYLVILMLFPFLHKVYIPSFSFGFGMGFLIHYLSRSPERRDALYARLRENLLLMIESMKRKNPSLSSNQDEAIQYYAKQDWKSLRNLLNKVEEDEVLFFIKLSMNRKQHKYSDALQAIEDKENENPSWYEETRHFFHLHYALNYNEKDNIHTQNQKSIVSIRKAIEYNPNCLLSITTLALMLANDIDISSTNQENIDKKNEALTLIWKAMKIYEQKERNNEVISLVTGLTVPFTYSFLLDTYGYVLFKNGYFKFSRALFIQCLYQDPSFSSTYVHLAEWYIEYYGNGKAKNENWIKAAKTNLFITLENEKLDDKEKNKSFIMRKAEYILQKLNNVA